MSKFENMNGNDILAHSLWNNKSVKVKSRSLYTPSLVRKGIKTINDLVGTEESIKNWETISKEFNLNPIHFFGVVRCMQLYPKQMEKRNERIFK